MTHADVTFIILSIPGVATVHASKSSTILSNVELCRVVYPGILRWNDGNFHDCNDQVEISREFLQFVMGNKE